MIAQYDPMAPHFRRHWVRVKNGTGSAIPPHSVVLLSSASQVDGEIVLTVIRPNAAAADFNWAGYYVTGPFEIGASSTSEGIATTLREPGYVRYDTGTPAKGQVWGPKHGQHTLSTGYWGYMILGGNTLSVAGHAVTIAQWIGITSVIGKIDDTAVSLGATCTVSVYNGSTAQTDTGMEILGVVNRGAELTGPMSSPYCRVSLNAGVPVLDWVQC